MAQEMTDSPSRAVITLATGKPLFVRLAVNLARSFLRWHRDSAITFHIITDQRALIPADLASVAVIDIEPDEFGAIFSPKLHLNKLLPAEQNFYIDADCLCVRDLSFVFDQLQGCPVGVMGHQLSEGEWFGDIAALCRRFDLPSVPWFNGGTYYIEKGEAADRIFETARSYEPQYDSLGLVRLRGHPNDELMMSIALALHGIDARTDDGTIVGDLQNCPGPLLVDVWKGQSRLINPPESDPVHFARYPVGAIFPAVVHFLGDHYESWQYRGEAARLEPSGFPALNRLRALCLIQFPGMAVDYLKPRLRGIYRSIFGVRSRRVSAKL